VSKNAPDFFFPLHAYRVWLWNEAEDRLTSYNGVVWPACKALHATHEHEIITHAAPSFSCACGIYCYKDLKKALEHTGVFARVQLLVRNPNLVNNTDLDNVVIGKIDIWGRIIEHSIGYRAEYAYPTSLAAASSAHCKRISELYQVPCEFWDVRKIFSTQQTRVEKVKRELREEGKIP
jgi:hypothetical protein